MKIRRVVTGFDGFGKSVVTSDEQLSDHDIPGGMKVSALWAYGERVGLSEANALEGGFGAGFDTDKMALNWGVSELPPGMSLAMHSTQTVDMITVLAGEVTCLLDSGAVITLGPHDVLLQRGVVHAWENRGEVPCAWTYATLGRLGD